MRYLMLLLFFSLPFTSGATISAPVSHVETAIAQQTIPHGFAPKKQRFFERLLEKKLTKRLIKAAGASKRDGRGFAIGGLIAFLISVVSWVISPLLGFTAGLPMALLGLLFSVICLSKAKTVGIRSKSAFKKSISHFGETVVNCRIHVQCVGGLIIFFQCKCVISPTLGRVSAEYSRLSPVLS